ncbi:MAG TPA: endonuclease [Bacteroidales bacterium]|nr:endonuclease [Bacteroidales bacterium]
MADHNLLGEAGEQYAADYLAANGYVIKHRNWRWQKAELDIIALKDNVIVFVEVKTRHKNSPERPQDAVTRKKQRLIIKAADAYITFFDLNFEARFDIISVIVTNKGTEIEHIDDAFIPLLK